MKNKKLIVNTLLLFILLHAKSLPADTASGVTVYSYKLTFTKLQLSQDGGQTFTTVFEGSNQFSINSVSAGHKVGNLAQNINIPAGTYNYLRIEMSNIVPARYEAAFLVSGEPPDIWYTDPGGMKKMIHRQWRWTQPDLRHFIAAALHLQFFLKTTKELFI